MTSCLLNKTNTQILICSHFHHQEVVALQIKQADSDFVPILIIYLFAQKQPNSDLFSFLVTIDC